MSSNNLLAWTLSIPLDAAQLPLAGLEKLAPLFPLVVGAIVVLAIIIRLAVTTKHDKKRTEDLEKAAAELSLPFSRSVSHEQFEQLVQFPLLQRGSSRESSNAIVAETNELRLVVMDHRFVTGSGKNRSVHRQTVAWVSSNQLNLPAFSLCPETWLHRLGHLIINRDIDFDDDPEFSQKFVLTGSDKTGVKDFFDSKRRQALLKISLPYVEAMRHGFIFYRPGKRIDPAELKSLMTEAFSLFQAFSTAQEVE